MSMSESEKQSLAKDIRELRQSIEELNGLLRSIFQAQAGKLPAAPKAKSKVKRSSGKPQQDPGQERPPPAGNHF
jgi:hypothetical protein